MFLSVFLIALVAFIGGSEAGQKEHHEIIIHGHGHDCHPKVLLKHHDKKRKDTILINECKHEEKHHVVHHHPHHHHKEEHNTHHHHHHHKHGHKEDHKHKHDHKHKESHKHKHEEKYEEKKYEEHYDEPEPVYHSHPMEHDDPFFW